MAIRAYHRSRGDDERTVCLIPSSAHGTNAASAVMAGLRVVVVGTDITGNVDVDDLRTKLDEVGDRLAGIMVTYPSTHGVFEESIGEVCDARPRGAVGRCTSTAPTSTPSSASPGRASSAPTSATSTCTRRSASPTAEVAPVSVRSPSGPTWRHSCPATRSAGMGDERPSGRCRPPDSGRPGILPIPWAYIALMGPAGLTRATAVAIASANYVATRLHDHYPVLYTGAKGRVGHECILDLRAITKATGVTAEDVAKRLMDYGFHAPTLSFPVAGTLMVEPTESEPLAELDRFCDAMIAIRAEIDRVARRHLAPGREPAAPGPAHGRGAGRRVGAPVRPRASAPTRCRRCGSASTSRRSRASTPPVATATSCARVSPWTRTSPHYADRSWPTPLAPIRSPTSSHSSPARSRGSSASSISSGGGPRS